MKHFLKNKALLFVAASAVLVAACNSATRPKSAADSAKTDTTAKQAITAAPADSGKLVGAWHDEAIKSDDGKQIAYEVISKGKKFYIQAITFTGTNLTLNDTPPITPSATEIKREGDHFVSVERPGESYKVDQKGNLLLYDNGQLVAVCKKIL
ncbi:hypothetical protein [Mucilaginibacter glaciei]|uniref:Lipoprotein n=1 Tax=Mucilaginibacter glaciei TaxID=2772109 RepID=A0A926NJV9_9SPHI|nr:hypothetical protein [Mucilaginibacter glaciei]MBD1392571.1 hypothetical protein [Mucilaginibacter glaciei]